MKPAITETHPHVAEQWHPTLNGDLRVGSVTSGSAKKVWWLGLCGHEWDSAVNVRTLQSQGCPYCTGKRLLTGYNDLAFVSPEIAAEWHPEKNGSLSPADIKAGSSDKVFWLGKCGHEWEAQIRQRVQKKSGCPICANQLTVTGINDLVTTHPELALLWDFEKNDKLPSEVNAGSKKKAHWKCPNNHEFIRPIAEQSLKVNGYCFECSPKNIVSGVNDLKTLYPDVAKEWHPTKNGALLSSTVSPESHNKVWWHGKCGHDFFAVIRNRAKKSTGCTICSNQQVLRGFNDLATSRPDFHLEWHPTKNIGLDPYSIVANSSKRVWWKCVKGHEWAVRPADRSTYNSGCPECNASCYVPKPEQAIADFIVSKGFIVKQSDRSLLKDSGIGAKEIDIVIPEAKLAIEFNGLYYHTEIMGKDKDYHFRKWQAITRLGYQLIQIWEDEWEKNPELIKTMIMHKLGISDSVKIFARKTTVSSVTANVAKEFLEANHIQGFAAASYYDGLFDTAGDIVALLALKKEANNRLNIVRYATAINVVGGFTKLLTYAERNYEVDTFVTFSDNCVSDGGLYENNGFIADKQIPPDYKYLWRRERKHKFQYRLKRFKTDDSLLWQEGLTERELAILNKLHRIWDAGKTRWVKKV